MTRNFALRLRRLLPRQVVGALLLGGALLAPRALAAQGATTPESHTVKSGDTLWDLARQYLGDPFLWPEIFKLNTSVVEDPHWIYPGEVLRLAPGGAVAAVPAEDTPAPPPVPDAAASADSALVEAVPPAPVEVPPPVDQPADQQVAAADEGPSRPWEPIFPVFGVGRTAENMLRAYTHQPYRPLRRSEFYSAGFLTENEKLPFGHVLNPVLPSQIGAAEHRTSALSHALLAVEPPRGGTYRVGDTLLVVRLSKEIDPYGDAVLPTGLVRVTAVEDKKTIVQVIAIYGAITHGQLLLPAEKFVEGTGARAAAVSGGVTAEVVGWPYREDLKAPQQVLYLDKGRRDGVAPGDIFEVRRIPSKGDEVPVRIDDVMAILQVVHVREQTATAKILNVRSPNIPAGMPARQVAKLPT